MSDLDLGKDYWESRWQSGETGWDIGYVSTPLKEYFDQVKDKHLKILIPGCGSAWEAEYLHNNGFDNVYIIDLAPSALKAFHERVPSFPESHLIVEDFFAHSDQYDLIVEQTFFCALNPSFRENYVDHIHDLLKPEGKLVGLLFDKDFGFDHPPYGGSKEAYQKQFEKHFHFKYFETAHNSIPPRQNSELFILLKKGAL